VALALILGFSLAQGDLKTRVFIIGVGLLGVPLAWWRGRASAPVV
jgi:hypothetical protein